MESLGKACLIRRGLLRQEHLGGRIRLMVVVVIIEDIQSRAELLRLSQHISIILEALKGSPMAVFS